MSFSLPITTTRSTVTSSLSSSCSRAVSSSGSQARFFAHSAEAPKFKDVDPRVRYPKLYFDFKAWQRKLKEKKADSLKWERRAIKQLFHKEAPEGWDPLTFLKKMQLSADEKFIEDFAAQFKSWQHFAGMDHAKIRKMVTLSKVQKRRLIHYLELFNHGLWPEKDKDEYYKAFQGRPYENEGQPWSPDDDTRLIQSAQYWGVGFGDVWLYVSHDLQRPFEECRQRYIQIATRPEQRKPDSKCEFVLSKCMQPLLMNRAFRILPSTVYMVPTEENFSLEKNEFKVPKGLMKYRDAGNFPKEKLEESETSEE